jgi:proteasome lid subunit RPN8/RPN11
MADHTKPFQFIAEGVSYFYHDLKNQEQQFSVSHQHHSCCPSRPKRREAGLQLLFFIKMFI